MFQGKGLLSDYSLSFFSFQLFICFPVNFKDDLSKYIWFKKTLSLLCVCIWNEKVFKYDMTMVHVKSWLG